jgi:hypothetical protein
MKSFVFVIAVVLVASFALMGCAKDGPMAPPSESAAVAVPGAPAQGSGAELGGGNVVTGNPASTSDSFQDGRVTSQKVLITARDGGTVKVGFTINNGPGKFPTQVQANLKFPAGALSENTYITMSVNKLTLETSVDLAFGPHGATFLKPAMLGVNTLNFDISRIQEMGGAIFYCADDGEPQKYESLNINPWNGKLTLTNAKIWHFSRYSFGR